MHSERKKTGQTSPGRIPRAFCLLAFLLFLLLAAGCGESACEHQFTEKREEEQYLLVPASCGTPAVYYRSCRFCGCSAEGIENDAIFLLYGFTGDHRPGEWTVVREADDLHCGLKESFCTVCGLSVTEEIPVPHSYRLEILTPPDKTAYRAGETPDPAGLRVRLVCGDCGFSIEPATEELCFSVSRLHAGTPSFSVSYSDGQKTYESEAIAVSVTRAAPSVPSWTEYQTVFCRDCPVNYYPHASAEGLPVELPVRDSAGTVFPADQALPAGVYEVTGSIAETDDWEAWEQKSVLEVVHRLDYRSSRPHVYSLPHFPRETFTEAWELCLDCEHVETVYVFLDGWIGVSASDLVLSIPYEVTDLVSVTLNGTEIPGVTAVSDPDLPGTTLLRTDGEALKAFPNGPCMLRVEGRARTQDNFWYGDEPVYCLEAYLLLAHE